jgi:hypothetical protein
VRRSLFRFGNLLLSAATTEASKPGGDSLETEQGKEEGERFLLDLGCLRNLVLIRGGKTP